MNIELKSFCWSCGQSIESCQCGSESVPKEVKIPREILPICGVTDMQTKEKQSWLDPDRKHEILPRPCCECGQYWPTTWDDWLYGTCPSCHAKGPDHKLKPEIQKNLIKAQLDELKKLLKL